jgi:D-threo-aldose 1-dehydrogenase
LFIFCADPSGGPGGRVRGDGEAPQVSLRDRRVISAMCGGAKPERVRETLDWARFPILAAFWQAAASPPFAADDPEATRIRQNA